jgi:DNA-nicking Smr family endonuclease
MDFGEILKQWEEGEPGAFRSGGRSKNLAEGSKAKGPATGARQRGKGSAAEGGDAPLGKATLSLIRWLNTNGVYDKDAEEEDPYRSPGERRRLLLARKTDAEIDLHGLNHDEAWDALERFFAYARSRGFLKISVIHGKGIHSAGEAILKNTLREFIERCPFAGESGHQNPRSGGSGATWVLLKRN